MVVLTENGLNKRHREFNQKVNEAVKKNVNFDDVKAEGNESDINNLFKIDLASKYKNIDYIIEVLKSGDSLCIARALKAAWIFGKEYSHIVNPQFISDDLFPHLSAKTKKKLLSTISTHVRDGNRALEFYNYCKSLKYDDIASKFLLFINEETKLKLIKERSMELVTKDWTYIKHFIGDSFILAEAYLESDSGSTRRAAIYQFRYLYSNSDIGAKYFDWLEKYDEPHNRRWYYANLKFGLRMSKDIILKHKNRIYKNPKLYLELLNKSMLARHSTIEDAKFYTTALLPENASLFWDKNYYDSLKHLFDIIPKEEKYQFIKKIFNEAYPGEPFETTLNFYRLRYHDLMVDLELKEEWALSHIKSEKEILGSGKDYIWYRFVKFENSFEPIKKYIRINGDADVRAEITNVLIESARNDRDLETLFKYYYERHINEERFRKERFLDAVNNRHNIFDFDSDCFAALDKIYYSLEIYNILTTFYCKPEYKIIALIYRIINDMEMPKALTKFMDDSVPFYTLRCYTAKLTTVKAPVVFDYLMKFYLDSIKSFDSKPYDDDVKKAVRKYVHFVLDLLSQYDKPKDEIPELTMKYVNLDWEEFKYHFYFRTTGVENFTQKELIGCLKRDKAEFVAKLPILKETIEGRFPFRLNQVLRKLRVYFSNDLAKEYFKFYERILHDPNIDKHTVNLLVFGIIHLADKKYLENFMNKYAPTIPKIDHVAIDRKVLSIQTAICSFAGYARPPVPLPIMLKYIKGDYTQFCLPLFNMYLTKLQPLACINFVKAIVDAPLSVQKHGLRLAFKCFPINDLKNLVADMWKRTKNVSLRLVIYKALHAKILDIETEDSMSLFEILNKFTSTVYEEDEDELFSLLTSNSLPETMRSEHVKTVWVAFQNLPFKTKFIGFRNEAVSCIERNFKIIEPKSFIENIVDEHVQYVFDHDQDEEKYKMLRDGGVIRSKWNLTAKYITYLEKTENLEKGLNLTKSITTKCITNWDEEVRDVKIFRNLFIKFLKLLKKKSYEHEITSYKYANIIFEYILKELVEKLPVEEIYQMTWELKLNIITRNVIVNSIEKPDSNNTFEVLKLAGFQLGKDLVALIAEYMAKNMFWIMYVQDIKAKLLDEAGNIVRHLQGHINRVHDTDILVLVCNELTEVKIFEHFFLASKMLHKLEDNVTIYGDEYRYVLHKLKNFEDPQIRCYVYQKFIRNNVEDSILIY